VRELMSQMMSNAVLERCEVTDRRQTYRWSSMGVVAIYWLGMFVGTHYPTPPHTPLGNVDKWMHFSAYLGLALLLSIATAVRRPVSLAIGLAIVLLLAGYGVFDELTQPLFGRDCELLDWCADVAGILIGTTCFQIGALVWRQRTSREADSPTSPSR
jgi:VanZ family protein